ncbi:MAG: DinB family protein [Sporichthyaceae bacterium]
MIAPEAFLGSERAVLEGLLDVQRAQVARILDDLDEAAARARLVPSLTTPLALVKHARFAERIWFPSRVAGVPREELGLPDTIDESFLLEPEDTVASVREAFLEACEQSRAIAAEHGLDEQFEWRFGPVNLRYVYAHMIAEHARHAGHGDILVEQLKSGASG